jgi:uncharacterized Zn finger protein
VRSTVAAVIDLMDAARVRDLASPRDLAEGTSLLEDGAVRLLTLRPRLIAASVAGDETVRVEFWTLGSVLRWYCSFPQHDGFCRHCVAVALLIARESGGAA